MVDITLIEYVGGVIDDALSQAGVDPASAQDIRDRSLMQIMEEFGGRRAYVQTPLKIKQQQIEMGWRRGKTIGQLAREFGLTERQIYNIVARL